MGNEKRRQLLDRLSAIETRLARLMVSPSGVAPLEIRLSGNRAELRAMRERIATIDSEIGGLTRRAAAADLDLNERTGSAIEERLRSLHLPQRVDLWISSLEKEVAQQRDTLTELHECSLQTERALQKVLKGIDGLLTGSNTSPHSG